VREEPQAVVPKEGAWSKDGRNRTGKKQHKKQFRGFALTTKHLYVHQTKKDEMTEARGTNAGKEKCIRGFGAETSRRERAFEKHTCRWDDNVLVSL
jgi:hypothetical protein